MRKFFILSALVSFSTLTFAQKTSKKPLDHTVYDNWQSITNERISNDGKWVAYVVKPQQADAELIISTTKNSNKLQVPRADTVRLTSDSKFAVFLIRPFYKDTRMARIKKKNPADFPKDTLGYISLGSGDINKIPAVKSFKMADKASVIVYLANVAADTSKKPLRLPTPPRHVRAPAVAQGREQAARLRRQTAMAATLPLKTWLMASNTPLS